MNKNTLQKLINNHHYAMSDKEISQLAILLQEEAQLQEEDFFSVDVEPTIVESPLIKKINKNRVLKSTTKIMKHQDIEE